MLICLSGSHKLASKELEENIDTQPVQSYFVPTPLVVASSSPYSVPSAMPSVPLDKNLRSQPHITASSKTPDHKHNQKPAAPQVTLEVNVVIPPPTKPRDFLARTAEVPLPRGPLSYEALVHLRKSASTKKTPLCPSVDHTIELEKHLPLTVEVLKPGSDRAHSQAPISKTGHPAVAPKPKKITPNISAKTPNEAAVTSDSLYKVKNATDPQVVRLEALQKLGLRKGQQSENETVGPLPPPKSHSSFDLSRSTRGPSYVNPSRSPSFCDSQVPSEPKHGPLQSSASFHHGSRWDQQPGSVSSTSQSNRLKAASLERSATLDNHLNAPIEPPHAVTATKPMKTTSAAEPVPHQASNAVGYTVMVVPGMGTDRKEALRKLGLLKN